MQYFNSLNIVVKESFLDNLLPNGTWSGMRGLLQREVWNNA